MKTLWPEAGRELTDVSSESPDSALADLLFTVTFICVLQITAISCILQLRNLGS